MYMSPLLASLVLVKVSILLFYKRIFVTPWFEFPVYVYIAIILGDRLYNSMSCRFNPREV